MVLVEGGNYSDIPIYGGSDISGISPGTTRVVVRDDAATSVGTAPVVGFVYGGGNGDYDYTSGDYAGLTPPVSTVSRVDMLSGTANNIFGGGYASQSNASAVNVNGGTVLDGVYGANNYKGSVTGAVTVNINGGTLGTSSNHLTSGSFHIILKVFSKLGLTDARLFRHNRLFHIGRYKQSVRAVAFGRFQTVTSEFGVRADT